MARAHDAERKPREDQWCDRSWHDGACCPASDIEWNGRQTVTLYQVLADGIPWMDSDGRDVWPESEALTLSDQLTRMSYDTDVIPA